MATSKVPSPAGVNGRAPTRLLKGHDDQVFLECGGLIEDAACQKGDGKGHQEVIRQAEDTG
jgi:hypothetical protein